MFQFDNILYEKNYGEIEGVEKIKKNWWKPEEGNFFWRGPFYDYKNETKWASEQSFCSVAPLLTQRLPKIESLWVKREFTQSEQEPLS